MKFFIFFLIILFSLKLSAQDTITTKVIIFDEDDMSKYDEEKNYGKNAIKFNPLLIANGEIPIYYERALNGSFSIEGAIGMTFKDYIGSLLDFSSDKGDIISDSKSEKIKSNVSFKLGLRFYTGGDVMDGFYFALEYANRKYSKEMTLTTNYYNSNTSGSFSQSYVFNTEKAYNEFKLIAGSQDHSYWDNFFIDYYFGVGIKKQNNIEIISLFDNVINNYTYNTQKVSKVSPGIYAGFKLGFEF